MLLLFLSDVNVESPPPSMTVGRVSASPFAVAEVGLLKLSIRSAVFFPGNSAKHTLFLTAN